MRIFDYVDIHVPYLEGMFQKRQLADRKMDYCVIEGEEKQFVYVDSRYENVLREDLAGGKEQEVYAYFTLEALYKTDEISKKNLGLVKLRYKTETEVANKHG